MLPKIIEAHYRNDYTVWLRFEDGVEGEVDLEAELWGDIFEALQDKAVFKTLRFDQELETLVWPNGADFAPEFLYQKLSPDYVLKPMPKSDAA